MHMYTVMNETLILVVRPKSVHAMHPHMHAYTHTLTYTHTHTHFKIQMTQVCMTQ